MTNKNYNMPIPEAQRKCRLIKVANTPAENPLHRGKTPKEVAAMLPPNWVNLRQ